MTKVVILYSGGRQWGGIETYLANLLRLYDRSVLELTLLSMGEWELNKELEHGGPSVRSRVLSGRRFRPRTVRDIRRVLREESADLLVSQGVVANAYARLAAIGTAVPSLVVVHSDIALDYPVTAKRWAFMLSDRLLRPVTRHYIAVSRYLKARMVESGIKEHRARVIYNGVSTRLKTSGGGGDTKGSGQEAGVRRPHRSDRVSEQEEATVRLVSAGRLHAVKNFDGLVRAMQLLPERVTLTVWGDGGERANLCALVRTLGLTGRVDIPGQSRDMAEALGDADIYVQTSRSEGCSFAVAEAMLHGKPVVVTPGGGLPEQVTDGLTGVVAKGFSPEALAAAISVVVKDRELASTLGEAGRRAAEDMYAMETWLEKTTSAFREAARPSAGPR